MVLVDYTPFSQGMEIRHQSRCYVVRPQPIEDNDQNPIRAFRVGSKNRNREEAENEKFEAERQGTDVSHFNEEPAILKARSLSDTEVLLLGK